MTPTLPDPLAAARSRRGCAMMGTAGHSRGSADDRHARQVPAAAGAALMAGGGTPATALLARLGIGHAVHRYQHDQRHPSFGREASDALGVAPERVFKTLVAEVDSTLVVAVVPVASQLDLKALAAAVGGKRAVMAEVAVAERATGYVAGGISPLGQRRRLPVVVDSSALGFPTVYCSGGRRGLELELAPADLVRAANAAAAPIAAAAAAGPDR